MENIRIICPDSHLDRNTRIELIIKEFEKWISDGAFIRLVNSFGGNFDQNIQTTQKIKWLKESFIDVWDYRNKQKKALTKDGEAARWLLQNDPTVIKYQDLIFEASERLGLIGIDKTLFAAPDYYLPLGGAKMSNLIRCQIAKKEVDRLNIPVKVIALSAMRPIAESERAGFIDTYAPNAVTEFDAITEGMKIAFSPLDDIGEEKFSSDNPNLSYCIKQFVYRDDPRYEIYCTAAPSGVPERRANSADTFKFLFDKFSVPKYSKLVNCTSQIYCSYQQVRALTFAVEYNVEFDTIGYPYNQNDPGMQKKDRLAEPVNYLQEIKATIDAMYDFINHYSVL